MISKKKIILKARELGFEDTGFTTAAPFETHKKFLADRQDERCVSSKLSPFRKIPSCPPTGN